MDIDGLFSPPDVRYRIGSSKPAGNRGVRGTAGAKNLKNRTRERPEELKSPNQITAPLASWGYVFQINTETVAVGASVNFSNNGPLNGINHTPGTAGIEVTLSGTYNLTFSVYTTQNNPQDWAVAVNGVARSRFNSAGQTITGTTTLILNASDKVTIRNVNTVPDPATLRTGDFTTAYVLIYKVDS